VQTLFFKFENHLHMNANFNNLAALKNLKVMSVEQTAHVKGGATGDEDKRRNSVAATVASAVALANASIKSVLA
jgi:hypothetical protein